MSRPSASTSGALRLPRARRFVGTVAPPGSKSIANRALLLASVASGETQLTNVPDADDVQLLVRALPQLGVSVRPAGSAADGVSTSGSELRVRGAGGPYPTTVADLFLGNAGTALRPLCALMAAGKGTFTLDGDEHMRRRPIVDLVDALRRRGVDIGCSQGGTPPVRLMAAGLPGGEYQLSGQVSSQFLSALLLAAPLADSAVTIDLPETPVSLPYIDLTVAMMSEFGVHVTCSHDYRRFEIPAQIYRSPGSYAIEADASAATYFLAAGALPHCGPVRVRGVGLSSRQGDARFREVLEQMGARVSVGSDWTEVGWGGALRGIDIDMNAMPDAAMTLAVLALFAQGRTHIRNVANLRVKESERIRGLRSELEKLGATVEETVDSLVVHPPEVVRSAEISTFDDHRMAMAFALASFGASIEIENPDCTSKTYPRFFEDFRSITDGTT